MNNTFFWKLILGIFTAITLYAVFAGSLSAALDGLMVMGPWGLQVSFDLVIAFGICNFWIWQDAKRKGINPLPYLIGTLLTGSIAILFYMAKHTGKTELHGNTVAAE
ncbi:hypothetical protein KFE96_08075 [Kordiimonas sp. SCSIO 12603]|uniref:hypothetical protein n=1 Tax=Kordiimonas sp. SCSIO 12603 TaxID=2829596 RepID=UPI002104A69B|nr:hypothetical protein [Kordiimonas sp. SCSIO 12603]UTW60259.1 hypothetical protein KFE96_08075 [Kordiimonas sp. SCSIO 12603]